MRARQGSALGRLGVSGERSFKGAGRSASYGAGLGFRVQGFTV